jgi:hypothetical protein
MAFVVEGFRGYDGNHAPKWPFVLNKDSPQAVGLENWWPSEAHGRDLARGGSYITPNGMDLAPTKAGVRGWNNSANGDELDLSTPVLLPPIPFSIALLVEVDSFPGNNNGWFRTLTGSSGTTFITYKTTSTRCRIEGTDITTTGTTIPIGRPTWLVHTFESLKFQWFIDGVFQNSNVSHGTADVTQTIFQMGWQSSTAERIDGRYLDMRFYSGVLKDHVIGEMYHPDTRWDLYHELNQRSIYLGHVDAASSTGPVFWHHYRTMKAR